MRTIDKLLTITVPAYNAGAYLCRCLQSVAQCPLLQEIEVLIINDGSEDDTPQKAAVFVQKYPDTFRLINKKNGGHGSAINTGVSQASGAYFIVLDADDWLDAKALAVLLDTIKNIKKEKADLISFHYHRVHMETGVSMPVKQNGVVYQKLYQFEQLPVHDIYFALASTCYRTAMLQDMGLHLQENTYYVDVEYMLLPLPYIQTVYFLDIYLYKYFVGNTQQSIHIPTMVSRYAHHNRVMHRVINQLPLDQLTGKKRTYLQTMLEKLLFTHYAISLVYHPNKKQGVQQAAAFDSYLKKASPYLYRRVPMIVPFARIYRRYHFNLRKVKRAYAYKLYLKLTDAGKKIRRMKFYV